MLRNTFNSDEDILCSTRMNSLNADIYHLLEGYLAREEFRAFLHVNKHVHGEYIESRHMSLNKEDIDN